MTSTEKKSKDIYLMKKVQDTNFLSEKTKLIYEKKILLAQNEIWTCDGSNAVSISTILRNPEDFAQKLSKYCSKKAGRMSSSCGDHYKDGIFSSLMALFLYNEKLKETEKPLFERWKAQQKIIREPIEHKYKSNVPTDRQRDAYMTFEEICDIRDSLPRGSQEKLLLCMYTMIPPVRSDYHHTKIYGKTPTPHPQGNFIVLTSKNPHIILQEYKTASKYNNIVTPVPPELYQEMIYSLAETPRKYLFTSPRTNQPFEIPSTFNTWANRTLKTLTKKKNFSLTMLRHIYITRRDLKLENKSGLEQEEVAKQMGHSITTLRRYMWHTYENQ